MEYEAIVRIRPAWDGNLGAVAPVSNASTVTWPVNRSGSGWRPLSRVHVVALGISLAVNVACERVSQWAAVSASRTSSMARIANQGNSYANNDRLLMSGTELLAV